MPARASLSRADASHAPVAIALTSTGNYSGGVVGPLGMPPRPVAGEVGTMPAPLGMPLGIPGQSGKDAMMQMMDKAYRQWLETTQQFYAAPVVAQPQVRQKG
jgi:hypothetical protein